MTRDFLSLFLLAESISISSVSCPCCVLPGFTGLPLLILILYFFHLFASQSSDFDFVFLGFLLFIVLINPVLVGSVDCFVLMSRALYVCDY